MTPHEKAVSALNARLARLQASLREAKTEAAQQFLFQSIVVTVGIAEALSDYIKGVGQYAQRRHGEVKQVNEGLAAQHADSLQSGRELLEKLKANPTDRALRKEIERVQRAMEAMQKNLRRGTNALQRDLAPSLAMIDKFSESVRRLGDTDEHDALKRVLKTIVGQVRELYAAQPGLPAKDCINADVWEKSAVGEIDQAAGIHDAYARAGYQTMLALALMTLALSAHPPRTADEATSRANEAVGVRVKEVAGRFTGS